MASSLVLKVSFNPSTDSTVLRLATTSDWTEVQKTLSAALERTTGSTEEFSVMYKDDDGDAIVINSQDCLDEAIRVVGSPLRVHITSATAADSVEASTTKAATSDTRKHQLDGAYIPPHLRVRVSALRAAVPGDTSAPTRGRRHGGPKVGRRNITIVKHVGGSDAIHANPSDTVDKTWRIRNDDATKTTPADAHVVLVSKHTLIRLLASDPIKALAPGEETDVKCRLLAPEKPGEYTAFLRMAHTEAGRIGPRLPVDITVVASSSAGTSDDERTATVPAKKGRGGRARHRGMPAVAAPALTTAETAELIRVSAGLDLPPIFTELIMADIAASFRNGYDSAITSVKCVAALRAYGIEDDKMARLLRGPQWEGRVQRCDHRMQKRAASSARKCHARGGIAAAAAVATVADSSSDEETDEAMMMMMMTHRVDPAGDDRDADDAEEEDDSEAEATAIRSRSKSPVTGAKLGADLAIKRTSFREAKADLIAAVADVKAAKKMIAAARAALDAATSTRARAGRMVAKTKAELAAARGRVDGFKAATASKSG